MYKVLITSFILIFSYPKCIAQIAAMDEKTNIIYIGVDNPLSVVVQGIPIEEIKLESDCVMIVRSKDNKNRFVANAIKPNMNCNIEVFHKGRLVEKLTFRIKQIPDPMVHLPINGINATGGNIKLSVFQKMTFLAADWEDFHWDARIYVQSFVFNVRKKNGEIISIQNVGYQFNSKVLDCIKNMVVGDEIYFEEVKAKCPGDDLARDLNSLIFYVQG